MRTLSAVAGRSYALLSAFVFAAFLSPGSAQAASPALFGPPAFGADAPAVREVAVMRARNVSIGFSVLAEAAAHLEAKPAIPFETTLVFFEVAKVVQLNRTETLPDGTLSLTGTFAGDPLSSVAIVSKDGVVSGNFTGSDGRVFQLRYRGAGVHEVREMDTSQFREHPGDAVIPPPASANDEPVTSMTDDASTIDVMVVYTPAARAAAGGTSAMQSLVNLGITETNSAYANSGVTQRVRLVYTGEITYTEAPAGDIGTDLSRLQSTTDGYMDTVHSLRNTYGADIVSLWVETPSTAPYCGIGYFMQTVTTTFAPNAFNVVARSCATGYYSFGHEMGHNMGLMHDTYMDNTTFPYPYAHGYVDLTARWRTVMAYNDQCANTYPYTNCVRLQYFSNPSVLYNGRVMGAASTADARTALNNTAFTVANFRASIVTSVPATPVTSNPTGSITTTTPTYLWTAVSGATSYDLLVQTPGGTDVFLNNYTVSAAGCTSGSGACAATPANALANGSTYNWFVRARNASGVSGWSAAKSITVSISTIPAAPVTSNPSGVITTASPTYLWTAVSGATSYDVLVQTSGGADVFLNNYTISAAGCTSGSGACAVTPANALVNGSTYNWFVRARNAAGISGWSAAKSITVAATLAVPVSSNPSGTITTTTPTYLWTAVSGSTSYDVLVQTLGGADVFLVNYTVAAAGCTSGSGACAVTPGNALANGTSYYWFVRARNAAGPSGWSTAKSITVAAALAVPVSSNPSGTITTTTPTYLWTAVSGATSYDLLLQTPGGADVFLNNYTIAAAGCTSGSGACAATPANALANGSSYYWFVRARNAGGASGWSTAKSITVSSTSIPAAPVLSQPSGTITTLTPTFLWTPAPGATSYNILVSGTSGGFSLTLTLAQAGCPSNSGACAYTPSSPLTNAVAYAWRVSATNAAGTGPLSNLLSFTTSASSIPNPPVPGAPSGTLSTLTPTFLWTPSPGATGYTLRVQTTSSVVISQALTLSQAGCPSNAGACGYTPATSLPAGIAYTWQVAASNAAGTSAFSAATSFNTSGATSVPAVPVLGAPNGDIIYLASTSDYPRFLWNPSPGATAYTFRLHASDGTVLSTSTGSLAIVGCPTNSGACGVLYSYPWTSYTTYQWSLRAENASGVSAYSAMRPFTIIYGTTTAPVPNPPVLGNPAGVIGSLMPTYLWTPSPGATGYTIRVSNGTTVVFQLDLTLAQAGCPSNAGACGYTYPAPLSPASSYTWMVSASNASGYSTFSPATAFYTP